MTTLIVTLVSSTLFFLLGVMVGREYAIRGGMATVKGNVEQAYPIESVPPSQKAGGKGKEKVDITFYDQLMKNDDEELNRGVVEEKAPEKTEKKAKPASESSVNHKKKGKEPAPRKAIPSGKGNYALQVASFRDKKRALRLAQILRKEGYTTHIIRVSIPGRVGSYYRVWVGYYRNLTDAASDRRRLLRQTATRIRKAIIVKRQ